MFPPLTDHRLVISKYDRFLGNAGNALKHLDLAKHAPLMHGRVDTQFDGTKIIQETQVRGAAETTSWTFLGVTCSWKLNGCKEASVDFVGYDEWAKGGSGAACHRALSMKP